MQFVVILHCQLHSTSPLLLLLLLHKVNKPKFSWQQLHNNHFNFSANCKRFSLLLQQSEWNSVRNLYFVCVCVCVELHELPLYGFIHVWDLRVYEVDSSNGCCNVRAKLTGSRNNNNETAAYPFPLVRHLPTPYPHCPTHHLQLSVARKWHSQALLTIHSTRFSVSVSYYIMYRRLC